MGNNLRYQVIIKSILAEHTKLKPSYGDIEPHLLVDDTSQNYVLIDIGWNDMRYVYGSVIHIQLKNEKIWIHYDGTEDGVAMELVDAGIPKQDIVLGFRHPTVRQYTEFAR
ncbi:hypothetical protein TI05_12265 [Achromatium sp. WMS3]|nr:hypothetical protein TI05_12265 [Achromatium sp. WMS3]